MKHNLGLRKQFSAFRLILCFLLLATAVGALPEKSQAAGIITHTRIVKLALDNLNKISYPSLAQVIEDYPGYVNYGSMFPDWIYVAGTREAEGESAHDNGAVLNSTRASFRSAVAANLLSIYRKDNKSAETQKAIAFLFGLIAHQETDEPWHKSSVPLGFEPWISGRNSTLGMIIEAESDMLVYNEYIMSDIFSDWHSVEWTWLPASDAILSAYTETRPNLQVTSLGLSAARLLQMEQYILLRDGALVGGTTSWIIGENPLKYYLEGYDPGGMNDSATHTARAWEQAWIWLNTYTPATMVQLSPNTPDGNNNWYRQAVQLTLTATQKVNGQINPQLTDVALIDPVKITWLRLDDNLTYNLYANPVNLSAEGINEISFYTQDKASKISETAQMLAIKIDTRKPVLDLSTNKSTYFRTEPLVVHINSTDPIPGSGMASLSGEFNGSPVTDGQQIDLFWLPLGTHTLSARAEDLAGNVTEVSQNIELTVTLESLKESLARLCKDGEITKSGTCNDLSAKVNAALAAHNRGNDKTAMNILNAFQNAVKAQTGKAITERAAQLLLQDGAYLLENLTP